MDSLYVKAVDTINITLRNLTERVNNIENLDYKFWIPTSIALVSIGYSIYQVWFQNRRELFFNVENKIDDARIALTSKTIELLDSVSSNDVKLKILDVYIENLLNKYDDGCRKYKQYKISRKEFKHKYHSSIVKIFEENVDKFPPSTTFINVLNYYNKEHRNH